MPKPHQLILSVTACAELTPSPIPATASLRPNRGQAVELFAHYRTGDAGPAGHLGLAALRSLLVTLRGLWSLGSQRGRAFRRDAGKRTRGRMPPRNYAQPSIVAAINGVLKEGAIAACLTALMILLFLGSWRSTLVVATSIPLSILCSITVLGALGQTLNIMTLGGLALAVGILILLVTFANDERRAGKNAAEGFRSEGTQVAIADDHNRIHWQTIQVGRDFGTQIEVVSGLQPNTRVVTNPTDDLRDRLEVVVKPESSAASTKRAAP